ncbi:MAG TPA: lipoyl domain-containing protein [Phycicoccus sp.]|nr:lipoyl domain-containing protein [Phycicoccus sp.]
MTEVPFPVMSQADPAAVGVLATWYVRDGEAVGDGQLIAEVQMDKVDMDVTAPAAGTIRLSAAEGDEVAQGTVIAVIE